jgi:hypothetical protein
MDLDDKTKKYFEDMLGAGVSQHLLNVRLVETLTGNSLQVAVVPLPPPLKDVLDELCQKYFLELQKQAERVMAPEEKLKLRGFHPDARADRQLTSSEEKEGEYVSPTASFM